MVGHSENDRRSLLAGEPRLCRVRSQTSIHYGRTSRRAEPERRGVRPGTETFARRGNHTTDDRFYEEERDAWQTILRLCAPDAGPPAHPPASRLRWQDGERDFADSVVETDHRL